MASAEEYGGGDAYGVSSARMRRRQSIRKDRSTRRTVSKAQPDPLDYAKDADGDGLPLTGNSRKKPNERFRERLQLPVSQGQQHVHREEEGGSGRGEDGENLENLEDSTAVVANLLHGIHHAAVEEESAPQPPPPLPTHNVLCVTVHCADTLRASVNISQPVVRVSIVDGEAGVYIKKSSMDLCVASFYERDNPSVDYVLPIMTQPFNCRKHNTLRPAWEESLIFNEQNDYLTQNENTVIFFELLDFPLSSTLPLPPSSSPWHQIAWAFLRPVRRGGGYNVGHRCRLQLYRYPRRVNYPEGRIEVHEIWSRGLRTPYPATLYVTAKPVELDREELAQHVTGRSMIPIQQEFGTHSFDQLIHHQVAPSSSTLPSPSVHARLPGQPCRLPLATHPVLPTSNGCSTVAFSHNGRYVATGCAEKDSYLVSILSLPSLQPCKVIEAHRGLVYCFAWSHDDATVASASADGHVKIWSPASINPLVCVLPHPCYVYSVCFCLCGKKEVVVSGAYDHTLRVWDASLDNPQLLQVLRGHRGHVNSIAWDAKRRTLLSADSCGVVGVWQFGEEGVWSQQRTIAVTEGVPITSISMHCNGRKLLVHSATGWLSMVDLRIDQVCREYRGIVSSGKPSRCSSIVSPCGTLVLAGDEGGKVHVWNADTGEVVHVYSSLPLSSPVCALAFHPREHLAIFSSFGPNQPLVMMVWEGRATLPSSTTHNQMQRLEQARRTLSTVTNTLRPPS